MLTFQFQSSLAGAVSILVLSCDHRALRPPSPAVTIPAVAQPQYCERNSWPVKNAAQLELYALSLHHALPDGHIPLISECQAAADNFCQIYKSHTNGSLPIGLGQNNPSNLIIAISASPWNWDLRSSILEYDTGKEFSNELAKCLGAEFLYYRTSDSNVNNDNNSSIILGAQWSLIDGPNEVPYPLDVLGGNPNLEGKDFGSFVIGGHGVKFSLITEQDENVSTVMSSYSDTSVQQAQVNYVVDYGLINSESGSEPAFIAGDFNSVGVPNNKMLQNYTIGYSTDLPCDNYAPGLDSFNGQDILLFAISKPTHLLPVAFPLGANGTQPTVNHMGLSPLEHEVIGALFNISAELDNCPCSTGTCLVTLASGQTDSAGHATLGLSVSGGRAYWWGETEERIDTVSTCGGSVTGVEYGEQATVVVSDSNSVYWGNETDGSIMKAPLGGTRTPSTLVSPANAMLGTVAVDSTNLYWTSYRENGSGLVAKLPLNGGPSSVLASGLDQPYGMALDTHNVYWATHDLGPTNIPYSAIMRTPIGGGAPFTIANGSYLPTAIAVDSNNLYWTDRASQSLMRVGLNGGQPVTIATGQPAPDGIISDGPYLYWITETSIMKMAKSEGLPVIVASTNGSRPLNLALDNTSIYWTARSTNTWSLTKFTPK